MQAIFDTMPSGMADYMMDPHNGTFPAFVGLIVMVQMILGLSGIFANKMEEAESMIFLALDEAAGHERAVRDHLPEVAVGDAFKHHWIRQLTLPRWRQLVLRAPKLFDF